MTPTVTPASAAMWRKAPRKLRLLPAMNSQTVPALRKTPTTATHRTILLVKR